MLSETIRIIVICLASLFVASPAQDVAEQGQVVFLSSSGEFDSSPGLAFDREKRTLKVDRFIASDFAGDSINFRGREIRNAHLVDSSIESLKHLTVESLALNSQDCTDKNGHGLAVIDGDGIVSTTRHVRWDETARELKLSSLSSFSKTGLKIRSDVDFTGHQLKNAKIEANTTLSKLIFKDGYIENSVLHNVTATGLNLGDVTLDSLSISQFDSNLAVGSLVVVGDGGGIELSSTLKQEKDGPLLIDSDVVVSGSVLGSGPYVDVSDQRFKKNVEGIESSEALDKILQLNGVSYELDFSNMQAHNRLRRGSSNPGNTQGRQFGFIAQDVNKLFPEIVSTDEQGFKGLQYSRFAPIFVEGLKQLTEEVRALQDEKNCMKRTIHLFEQRLKALEDL